MYVHPVVQVVAVLRPRPQRSAFRHHTLVEKRHERRAVVGHPCAGRGERVRRRLEALQQRRPQQPDDPPLVVVFVGLVDPIPGRLVAGQRQHPRVAWIAVGLQRCGDVVEEAGQHAVEVVLDLQHPWGREHDRLGAVIGRDGVVRIPPLDERACPPDRHGVEHVEQQIRGEVGRVDRLGGTEMLPHRRDSDLGERRVVAHKQAHLVIQVPQAVVDRRRCQQHQLLRRRPAQQAAQRLCPVGGRVAQIVGFVDHHHRVLVDLRVQFAAGAALGEPAVSGEIVERPQLERQIAGCLESLPRPVAQRRRSDDEHPLPALDRGLLDQRAGQERLAEAHLIRDQHPVVLGEDPLGPPHSVLLEGRQADLGAFRFLFQLGPVTLPQHPQIHQPRRVPLKALPEQVGQVVRLGLVPQVVEPFLNPVDRARAVDAQVELLVGGQPRPGEVGGPGHDAVRAGADQERLAVQEPGCEPADLYLAGLQPVDKPSLPGVRVVVEAEHVTVCADHPAVLRQRRVEPGALGFRKVVRLRPQHAGPVLRRHRLGADQQPDLGGLVQGVGDQQVASQVEVGGGDVQPSLGEPVGGFADETVESPGNRGASTIQSDLRLRLIRAAGGAHGTVLGSMIGHRVWMVDNSETCPEKSGSSEIWTW